MSTTRPTALAHAIFILTVATLGAAVPLGSQSTGPLKPYCFEGAKYTCFALAISTAPSANGTTVTVQLANREGAPPAGVPAHVDWGRIYAVDLLGAAGVFAGGPVVAQDPAFATTGTAKSVGDTRKRWFMLDVAEDGGDYVGYELETPYTQSGADIVGCTVPPQQGYPYFQTCGTGGTGAVAFSFETAGTWTAEQVAITVVVDDPYSTTDPMSCIIAGSQYDVADAYHCKDMSAPTTQTATLTLANLTQVYDGTPKAVTVNTTPVGVVGVSVQYSQNGTTVAAPITAGSYDVVASLTNTNYVATNATGTLVITRAPQTITFAPVTNHLIDDAPFVVSATGGGSGNPVTISSTTPSVCTTFQRTITIAAVGTCTVQADQVGSANYQGAAPVQQSFGVIFPFMGFLAPVANPPVLNVVKAGSSVPMKFSLNASRGLSILQAGSPSSAAVACSSSTPLEPLTATTTPGRSTLEYDPAADQYTYVWATNKSWTGCRDFVVTLSDGTTRRVRFSFK